MTFKARIVLEWLATFLSMPKTHFLRSRMTASSCVMTYKVQLSDRQKESDLSKTDVSFESTMNRNSTSHTSTTNSTRYDVHAEKERRRKVMLCCWAIIIPFILMSAAAIGVATAFVFYGVDNHKKKKNDTVIRDEIKKIMNDTSTKSPAASSSNSTTTPPTRSPVSVSTAAPVATAPTASTPSSCFFCNTSSSTVPPALYKALMDDAIVPPSIRETLINSNNTTNSDCTHQALQFMAVNDTAVVTSPNVTASRLRQRFALAVLYCVWEGRKWKPATSNRKTGNDRDEHEDDGKLHWNDPDWHECDWVQNVVGADPCDDNERIRALTLDRRLLSTTIPVQLGLLSHLRILRLGQNTLRGTIPTELEHMIDLKTLSLHSNRLTGSIPGSVLTLPEMESFNVANNQLTGEIQLPEQNTTTVQQRRPLDWILSNNRLSGSLPSAVAALPIRRFRVDYNRFSGTIPAFKDTLAELIVHDNYFTGMVPVESLVAAAKANRLEKVKFFHNNGLTGNLTKLCEYKGKNRFTKLSIDQEQQTSMTCSCCDAAGRKHSFSRLV